MPHPFPRRRAAPRTRSSALPKMFKQICSSARFRDMAMAREAACTQDLRAAQKKQKKHCRRAANLKISAAHGTQPAPPIVFDLKTRPPAAPPPNHPKPKPLSPNQNLISATQTKFTP